MAKDNMDLLGWLRKQLAEAEPDLLREMVRTFAESLMGAEADALCGAGFRDARRIASTAGTATGSAPSIRAPARSPWRCRS